MKNARKLEKTVTCTNDNLEHEWGAAVVQWQCVRSTGQVIYPAPGTLFIPKFISLALDVPYLVQLYGAALWPKTPVITFNLEHDMY